MAPKIKQDDSISYDRQSSSFSTLTASTVSSASMSSDNNTIVETSSSSSKSSTNSLSSSSIINFAISLVVYIAFVHYTKTFVPSHDEAYDRSHPFQTTRSGDIILNFELNHPLTSPASVPSRLLFQSCVILPLLLMTVLYSFNFGGSDGSVLDEKATTKRNSSSSRSSTSGGWNCALAAVSGLLTAIGVCEVSTHMLKYYVLRRRPNFYALCQWDEASQMCTASPKKILEAQLSFPSGHASISWCGMTFLVLVLLGRLQQQQSNNQSTTTMMNGWKWWLLCWIPWSWSAYVSASRIADKWHHASDVVAGVLIGFLCAVVSYHSLFPPIFSVDAGTSYAQRDAVLLQQKKNQ